MLIPSVGVHMLAAIETLASMEPRARCVASDDRAEERVRNAAVDGEFVAVDVYLQVCQLSHHAVDADPSGFKHYLAAVGTRDGFQDIFIAPGP